MLLRGWIDFYPLLTQEDRIAFTFSTYLLKNYLKQKQGAKILNGPAAIHSLNVAVVVILSVSLVASKCRRRSKGHHSTPVIVPQ